MVVSSTAAEYPLSCRVDFRTGEVTEVKSLSYEARTSSGLTQKQLAELVGTKQPVIARLEDADYEGHSLSLLQKIARALNHRIVIHLTPIEDEQSA